METKTLVMIAVILILLLIVVGAAYKLYYEIRRKVRRFSSMAFGTENLLDGIQTMEQEEELTPKSVASATGLYLPSIMKDFPDFHYEEMKTRAENVLTSYLESVEKQDPSYLTEGTSELKDKLVLRINELKSKGQQESFKDIHIHKMEIHQYRKEKGRCSIILQAAVESIHYLTQDGNIIRGKLERKEQSRYNVELLYIQDRDVVENAGDKGLAMNCPNCGAPLPGLGAKYCEYCGSPVVEFNIRTWNFASVREA